MGLRQFCQWLLILGLCLALAGSAQASLRMDNSADVLSRTTGIPAFGNVTFMMWMYTVSTTGADQIWCYLADSSAFINYMGLFRENSSSKLVKEYLLSGSGDITDTTGTTVSTGTWMHIALVFNDATNTFVSYLNGAIYGSTTNPTQSATWGYQSIGNLSSGGPFRADARFMGFKQFTGVLTQAQVQAEMGYLAPVLLTNLHSWSSFRTASDTTSQGGGTNWTVGGTLSTEADAPVQGSAGQMFLSF